MHSALLSSPPKFYPHPLFLQSSVNHPYLSLTTKPSALIWDLRDGFRTALCWHAKVLIRIQRNKIKAEECICASASFSLSKVCAALRRQNTWMAWVRAYITLCMYHWSSLKHIVLWLINQVDICVHHVHLAVSLYPPRGGAWPSTASKPEDTRTTSGANSLAIGMTTVLE